MEQRPSWKANSFSPSKEIPCIFATVSFIAARTRAWCLSLFWAWLTTSTISSYFLKIHFNITLPSTSRSSKWSIALKFTLKTPELITPSLNCICTTNSKLPIRRQDSNYSPWNGSRFETAPCGQKRYGETLSGVLHEVKKKSHLKTMAVRLSVWGILPANKPFVGFSWNSVRTFTTNCHSNASFTK